MKNELGIEVCCENCRHYNGKCCTITEEDNKRVFKTSRCWFLCNIVAYPKRIKELQEQQFTEKELHIIKNMITILLSHNQQLYELHLTPLLKKLERIINEQ